MYPEQFFATVKKRIKREWVVCFVSTFVFGFIAHFYKFVNWLPNWDSIVFRYDAQDMAHLGRWFLGAACLPSTYYELPWLNSLLSMFYLALAAVCVCRMFRVRTSVAAALTGGLMAAFPTVTSTLTYCYVADGYCMALLFAVLSAMLIDEGGKKRLIAGGALLTLTLGIYQAYISVTILLLLIKLIERLIFDGETAKESLQRAGRFLVCGVSAGVLYLIIVFLSLKITNTPLSDYLGLDSNSSSFNLLYLPRVLYHCAKTFEGFFFNLENGISLYAVLNAVMLCALIWLIICAAKRGGLFKSHSRTLLLIVYSVAAPICASPLYFISPGTAYHNLMTMGFYAFYLFFILFYERLGDAPERFVKRKNWGILLLSAVMLFNFTLISNVAYHKLQLAFYSSYGEAIRMADRIEQTDGTSECDTLAVLGIMPGSEAYSAQVSLDLTGVTDGSLLRPDDYTVNQSVITSTLNDYCRKNFKFATADERRALAQNPEVLAMPMWPESGSVAVVDGYIVIRLSEGSGLYD